MNKKDRLFSIGSILLLFCVYTYMTLWENRFINSRVIYLLIAVLSLFTLFISSDFHLERQAVIFFIIVIYNVIQLSLMKEITNHSIKWIETIIIYAIILFALLNSFQKHSVSPSMIKIPLTVLCGIFVFSIYLQKMSPDLVERINRFILTSDSIKLNQQFFKWGYYCGFSGLTFVAGLDCMIFGILQLDRAMSNQLNKVNRIICFVCVLLAIYGTILVQKRGLFIATLVGIVVYILLKTEKKKNNILSLALIACIGLVCFYLLSNNESGALFLWRAFEKEDVTSGRSDMWADLIKKSYDALITGYGPASVTAIYSGDAHNIYLQILYENGIIGLGLYLAFFGLNIKSSYSCLKAGNNLARIGIAVQIAILFYGFTGNPLTDIFIFLLYLLASTIGFLQTSSAPHQEDLALPRYKYIKY